MKHPGVAKPDDWKPYVPPAPKENKRKKGKSAEQRRREDRERMRKKRKEAAEVVAWAQCDACQKWRVLPKDHVVDEGAAWSCSAVGRSCDERADDAVEEA